ncbi:MAG: c-type cytochrome [Gammaproteobacteria bacterium]
MSASSSIVWPDGQGLPAGSGTVAAGRALYAERCIQCHGRDGRGGPGGELAGGDPDLTAAQPDQNIGTYWPHATTLFDFVRRAMPLDAPWSLGDAQTYALVAYLLHLNGLLEADARLDADGLRAVRMPNRDGFVGVDADYRPQD